MQLPANGNSMTAKQRLLTALRRQRPDRVPVVATRNLLGENVFTREPSYASLVEHARKRADTMYKIHVGSVRYLDHVPRFNPEMQVIVRHPTATKTEIQLATPRGELSKTMENVPGTFPEVLRVTTKHLIHETSDVDRYLSIPYEPRDLGIDEVRLAQEWLGENGLVLVSLWDPIGSVCSEIDPTQFAIWSITERTLVRDFTQEMFRRISEEIEGFLKAGVGEVFYFNGPEFVIPPNQPPAFFDEYVGAFDAQIFDLVHRYGKLAVVHCHGKVAAFLERFADMGAEAIHPLEPPPSGDVEIAEAKQQVGDRLCLIGNIEYRELAEATAVEIQERVKALIRDAGSGGGLIVSPCSGLYEVPLAPKTADNYRAMIDAVHTHGTY